MGGYKLANFNKIASELGPGEQVVAGAFGMPPGGVRRQMLGAAGGAIGAIAAGSGKGDAGSFQLPRRFVLGLTPQRLLVCAPDAWLGKPKKVLYAIPLDGLASAEWGTEGKMSQQAVFTMRDGQELVVETMKRRTKPWLEDLLQKIQPLLSRR